MTDRINWADVTPSKRGEVWVRREGDETAIFDPGSGRLYALNASALALWELCDGSTSPAEMAEAIAELTGRSRGTTTDEVVAILDTLLEQDLISVRVS